MTERRAAPIVSLLFFTCLFCLSIPVQSAQGLQNQLIEHPSPYLAMHGADPVQWQSWGPEVLQAARELGRPIFISSGYFSCHWCHVMQRESYADPDIASLLNAHFIPVKIDRELRPALDDYLIQFVEQTTGVAGWPLNVFLTPEGYPMLGLTYAPADNFQAILQRIVDTWQVQSDRATELARELVEFNRERQQQADANVPAMATLDALPGQLVAQALAAADSFEGGFGEQSRFPMAPQLLALLDVLEIEGRQNNLRDNPQDNAELASFLRLTLKQMQRLGLRDHVNGGFFRYTVDPGWQEPHFEKMLYTQALLARVYLDAAQVFSDLDYLQVARDTLDYVLEAMAATPSGYLSSYSAVDDQNVEGGGYLWSMSELTSVLDESERKVVQQLWQLTPVPRFQAGYLPLQTLDWQVLAQRLNLSPAETRRLAGQALSKLRATGKVSTVPRDNKAVTSWNALLLSTFSQAAMLLGDEIYRDAACQLRDALVEQAWDGTRLIRVFNAEQTPADKAKLGRAGLEDYAYLAMAIREYAVLQDSEEDHRLAIELARRAWELFYQQGNWRTGDENLLPGMLGQRQLVDGALPAADAMLMQFSLAVDDTQLRNNAIQAAEKMLNGITVSPFDHATHLAWVKQWRALSPRPTAPGAG